MLLRIINQLRLSGRNYHVLQVSIKKNFFSILAQKLTLVQPNFV